jgi:hypothetical protein
MILIINHWCHIKNLNGFKKICQYLNMNYKIGEISDIESSHIIFSPSYPIDIRSFKDWEKKIWIFGPHFSVFPNEKLININFKNNNLFYIMPSKWCVDLWNNFNININILSIPFPVDMDRFNGILERNTDEIVIYYKNRNPNDLVYITNYLNNKGLNNLIIFDYKKGYKEEYFMEVISRAKFGIVIVASESQGFAIEEMMSSNLPLLVWNVSSMKEEYNSNYPDYKATSIPYWDNRCGEYFYNIDELENKFKLFINKLRNNNYNPREYVKENLSIEICSKQYKELIIKGI